MIENKKHFIEKYNIGNYVFLLWMIFLVVSYFFVFINNFSDSLNQLYFKFYLKSPLSDYLISIIIISSMLCLSFLSVTLKRISDKIPIFLVFGLVTSFIIISFLGKTITSLLAFIWIFILCWVLGKKIVNVLLKEHDLSWLEITILSIAIGFGVYSFFVLGLLVAGIFYPAVIYSMLILFSLIFLQEIIALFRESFDQVKTFSSFINNAINPTLVSILISVLLIMILVNFINAIAPETAYDGLNYHLTVPKIYIEHHRIVNLPNILQSYFAKSVEIIYASGMIIGGQITAKLISYGFGILSVLSIICLAKRFFSLETAIIAASLFFIAPHVSWLTTTTDVELAVSFYAICVIFVLLLWRVNNKKTLLFLCGILAGIALSVKLTSILFLIPIALSVIMISYRSSGSVKRVILDLVVFGLPILIMATPWYLITYFQTGNPVFPFFNGLFKSPLLASVNTNLDWKAFGMGYKLKDILLFPFYVTYFSEIYGMFPNGTIGIIMFLSIPSIFFIRKSKEIFILIFVSIISIIICLSIVQYFRYMIPILGVLSILAGYLLSHFINNYTKFYKCVCGSLLIINLFTCVPVYLTSFLIPGRIPYRVALGLESRDDYLRKVVMAYPIFQYLNQHYDPSKIKVFLLGYELRYYLNAPSETQDSVDIQDLPCNEKLPVYLKRKGFTHIIINALNKRNQVLFAGCKKNLFELINNEVVKKNYAKLEYKANTVKLYKLTYNHSV